MTWRHPLGKNDESDPKMMRSGPTTAIWVNAVSFVVSLLIVKNVVQEPEIDVPLRESTYMEDLREGFTHRQIFVLRHHCVG